MAVPKKVRDELLVEAQHRCTICSERCFEIHHIVEQSEGGTDDPENLIVLCPNCHQHRYHRCGEFTRDQLRLYKQELKESSEVERRLLQNLEEIRSTIGKKSAHEAEAEIRHELEQASKLIDPDRRPRLAASIEETAKGLAEESLLPEAARKAIELQYEVERQRRKARYPEIKIIGADDDAHCKSDEFPLAYKFVLVLNLAPQGNWCEIFDQHYEISWYNMRRKTRIVGGRLEIIVASTDDLQRHVEWAKDLVKQTNEWVFTKGFMNIDSKINLAKMRSLEEFDAIQSMKDRTRNLKI